MQIAVEILREDGLIEAALTDRDDGSDISHKAGVLIAKGVRFMVEWVNKDTLKFFYVYNGRLHPFATCSDGPVVIDAMDQMICGAYSNIIGGEGWEVKSTK